MSKEETTEAKCKRLYFEENLKQAEIADLLGISRQAVHQHLNDKSKRRRTNVPLGKVLVLRKKALARYHQSKIPQHLQ